MVGDDSCWKGCHHNGRSIPDAQLVPAAGRLAVLDRQRPRSVRGTTERRLDSKLPFVRLEGWDSRDAGRAKRQFGSKQVELGRNSRRARSIPRDPSFRHSLLAADGHALRPGSRSATTIERSAAASTVTTGVEFTGAIESVRAAIHRFRFEHSLLATDSSAVRRK